MKTGMLAAEAAFAALGAGRAHDELADYRRRLAQVVGVRGPVQGAQREARPQVGHVARHAARRLHMWLNDLAWARSCRGRCVTTSPTTSRCSPPRQMPRIDYPEVRRRAHVRQALVRVPVEHQPRGGPAVAPAAARSVDPGRRESRALRRSGSALLSGRRVRIRRRRAAERPVATASACRSTRRTACTARPATSRIRGRTSTGSRPRAAADRTTRNVDAARSGGRSFSWPQPRRAAHAARIAMRVPARAACRRGRRTPTAPHSRGTLAYSRSTFDMPPPSTMTSGIEDVDHVRQRAREALLVARERRLARRIAGRGAPRRSPRAASVRAGRAQVIAREARTRQERLDAARAAAEARRARAARRRAATAADCGPTRRRCAFGPSSTRPRTTMPAPTPVPRITPNTTSAPAPAPSIASDSAKQFASLVMRTSRPSTRVEVARGSAGR